MSTWWEDSKNMTEIEFSLWLFELPAKFYSQFSPSGSIFLPCLSLPSKSHRENPISFIFLESSHQVDMKNVIKSSKHFFGYFNTLETHSELTNHDVFTNYCNPIISVWSRMFVPKSNSMPQFVDHNTKFVTIFADWNCLRTIPPFTNKRATAKKSYW